MDDLISRQDALDAIEERIKANGYVNVALISELNRLDGYIRQLPSAQFEIIRCKDCRWFDTTMQYGTVVPDAFYCKVNDRFYDSEHFCGYGERRE